MKDRIAYLLKKIYKDKLSKETFWATIAKTVSTLGGVFVIVFVPKLAGAEEYGRFSLILSYIYILGVFFGTPIQVAVKKEISEKKFQPKAKLYFSQAINLKLIFSFIASGFLIAALNFFDIEILKENIVLFLILMAVMNFWGLIVNSFEAVHRLFYEAIIYVVEYLTKIILIIYFYFTTGLTAQTLLISFICGYFLALIIGLIIFSVKFEKTNRKTFIPQPKIVKIILRRSFFLALTSISSIILLRMDTIIISSLLSIKDVGLYSIASDITRESSIISVPIILGVIPLFANNKNNQSLFISSLKKLFLINGLIMIAFFLGSGFFVKTVYGTEYKISAKIIRTLSPLPLLLGLQGFAQHIFVLKDEIKRSFVLGLIAMLVNIVLSYFFILRIGILGAAVATIISYLIWIGLAYPFFRKNYLASTKEGFSKLH